MKKLAIFLFILLALSGCRYRISLEENDEYTSAEYTPEYTPEPYIEATPDEFAPLPIEVETQDARSYAALPIENDDYAIGYEAPPYQEADHTITAPQPAITESEVVLGGDYGIVGLIAAYSTVLRQGVNTIFPCQLKTVYVETTSPLTTVARGSQMYQLIIYAGGLNVSTRLSAENLTVTADWVVRRSPDVIVKFADAAVLGSGISHTHFAAAITREIKERPDWSALTAVHDNRVLILSEQMLDSEEAQLAAKILIASLLYPELFENIDINYTAANLLSSTSGIFFYLP
ncbi:MAG: hypothetical protein FWC16_14780 [Defluviitaleaceae bacterium]|nr:hypothetical protein [Defluviitaleaceae bacterium]MCL2276180.1 hypothetical protein [Defluviitaleaceae bacterium]